MSDALKRLSKEGVSVWIPATQASLAAITEVIGRGISVNVTLIFSLEWYRAVMDAYLAGLEKAQAAGLDLSKIHSVASFSVFRVDTETDKRLDTIGSDRTKAIKGRAAVANAHLAYQAYEEVFACDRWAALEKAGANKQRPLWASTGAGREDVGARTDRVLARIDPALKDFAAGDVPGCACSPPAASACHRPQDACSSSTPQPPVGSEPSTDARDHGMEQPHACERRSEHVRRVRDRRDRLSVADWLSDPEGSSGFVHGEIPGVAPSSSRPGVERQSRLPVWRVPPDAGRLSLHSYRAEEGAQRRLGTGRAVTNLSDNSVELSQPVSLGAAATPTSAARSPGRSTLHDHPHQPRRAPHRRWAEISSIARGLEWRAR